MEHVLDSWDLAFTLVLMLPVSLRGTILQSPRAISPLQNWFLKPRGKKVLILPKKTPCRLFSSPCNTHFAAAAAVRRDFQGKQFSNPFYLDIWKPKGISLLCAEGWCQQPAAPAQSEGKKT